MSVGAESNYNNDDNDKPSEKKVPLREMAKYLDILMGFVEDHSEPHITSLCCRSSLQGIYKMQTKMDTFFKLTTPVMRPTILPIPSQ